MSNSLRFLKFLGSKWDYLQTLERFVPENFERIFEPFLGTAALTLHLNPPNAVLSDVNEELINLYLCLVRDIDLVVRLYESLVETYREVLDSDSLSSAFYDKLRKKFNKLRRGKRDPEIRAAILLVLNRVSYNGVYRVNQSGDYNVPADKRREFNFDIVQNMRNATERLKKYQIYWSHYKPILDLVPTDRDFVYLDPPYFKRENGKSFVEYSQFGFTVQDHEELFQSCELLTERGVRFLMTNADVPFIRERFASPRYFISGVEVFENLKNRKCATNSKFRSDVIITNYPVNPPERPISSNGGRKRFKESTGKRKMRKV